MYHHATYNAFMHSNLSMKKNIKTMLPLQQKANPATMLIVVKIR